MKKLICILLVLSLMLPLAACQKEGGGDLSATVDGADGEKTSAFNSKYADLEEPNKLAVLWSDNFTVSVSMYTYYLSSFYRNYVEQYGDSITFDTSVSLREQYYLEAAGMTWFNYMTNETSQNVQLKLFMCEAALEEGMTLTDEYYEKIDAEITNIDNTAKGQQISTEALIKDTFGENVNEATIRKCLEITYLAEQYNVEVLDKLFDFTDEDYEKFFEENKENVLSFNYLSYMVPEGNHDIKAEFAACTTEEEFLSKIRARMPVDYPEIAAEDYDSTIETFYVYGEYYNNGSDFTEWVYEDGRSVNDVYTADTNDGELLLAMMLPASESGIAETDVLYRDTTPTHNVSSILFRDDVTGGHDLSKTQAEKLYQMLVEGAMDFTTACNLYGGGSTSNITIGSAPLEIQKWIFDENRVTGEYGIVELEDKCFYVLQMHDDGMITWQYICAKELTDIVYNDAVDAFADKYTVDYSDDAMSQVADITL